MIKISNLTNFEYQKFWQEHRLNVLQSYAWGQIKEGEGWQVLRIGIFQDDKLMNALSIQVKKLGLTKFAYIPKIKEFQFWQELKEYCKHVIKVDFVVVEFDHYKDMSKKLELPSLFVQYNEHIQPEQTNMVLLHKTEEELFASLKGNYRRNIKKAKNNGVICEFYEHGEEMAVDKFYYVLKQVFANTKFLTRPKKYFTKVWQELASSKQSSHGLGAESLPGAVICTASLDKEILGAYLIVNDNSGAYELYGGVTKNGRDHEAGYLLKWEAIKYFNAKNKDFYDHWGVSKRTHHTAAILYAIFQKTGFIKGHHPTVRMSFTL